MTNSIFGRPAAAAAAAADSTSSYGPLSKHLCSAASHLVHLHLRPGKAEDERNRSFNNTFTVPLCVLSVAPPKSLPDLRPQLAWMP